jgi:hypothetical protein
MIVRPDYEGRKSPETELRIARSACGLEIAGHDLERKVFKTRTMCA